MDFFSRRFQAISGSSRKFVNQKDDSSSEEEGDRPIHGSGQTDPGLRSPRINGKWPSHLQNLFHTLSISKRHAQPVITAAIDLLYLLKLDGKACENLRQSGLIDDMAIELRNGTLRFDRALSGRGSFLIRIFEHLVLLDNTKAARKFLQLCDEQSLPLVIETEANNYLHARLQGDAKTAKDEMAFYTKSVKTTIKGGVAACLAKNKLERLIKGCPPNARHKLRKLLADDVVSQARDQSPSLTSAILALQNAPPEWSEADLELTSLVLNIRTVLSDIEVDKQLSFVKNEKVVELFRAIEEGLSKKTLDLSALLVKLCPGANTTTGAAIFVGALVGHLISKAEGPFDFEGVLSAVRLSGMPGAYTKHIAYPALMAMTGEDATRLAQAMSNLLGETGITLAELMALKQLATELEFYAVEHELPSKSWTLIIHQSTDAIRKFTETRAGMQDSEEQARHDAEVRERELKAKQRMRENEAKLKEERKNNILASLPDGVTGTMALFSEHGNIAEKVSRVRALLDQLDEKHLDVHKIACDLAELGSTDALGLLGSLAAALPPEDGRALLLAVPRELRERLNYEATVRAIASNWWHIKAGPEGRRDLVGIVKEFCDFIKPLKALVGFDAWSCGRHMRSITIGNMQPHELEYTQDHETVERMLGKL